MGKANKAQEDKQYTQHRGILDTIFTNLNAGLLRVSNACGANLYTQSKPYVLLSIIYSMCFINF